MHAQAIPNNVIDSAFRAVKWPVATAASIVAPDDTERWPPLLIVEMLEATVKESVGSVLHDQQMIESGHAVRQRVDDLRTSARTEAAAEALAARARDDFEQSRQEANRRRAAADEQARRERARADETKDERKKAAEQAARRREAKVRQAAAEREKVVESRSRAEKLDELNAESAAVRKEKAALAAKREASRTDAELRRTRARRRAATAD